VWLAAARVTTAADLAGRRVVSATQVALTAEGMRALGVPEGTVAGFSAEFLSGMAGEDARSRRLGDFGLSAPSHWRWGGLGREPHVLVMLYAERGGLAALRRATEAAAWRQGFEILEAFSTADRLDREPFGFADGISQPRLDWAGERRVGTEADVAYMNLLATGEFLLGYPNEYGLYTERPLLDPIRDPRGDLPAAEDDPGRRDLGRNGSYLVFRQLHQDVAGFWRFLAEQAADPAERVRLAEWMVGRTMAGDPLIGDQAAMSIPGVGPGAEDIARNGFTYDGDEDGARCPVGAHVRRANPRTGDMPGGRQGILARLVRTLGLGRSELRDDLVASSRFHRILRRGRAYGDGTVSQPARPPGAAQDDGGSGLHFICLNANISRQFEFIQNAWLISSKFDGLSGEGDPLLGGRAPLWPESVTDAFTLPRQQGASGAGRRLVRLPRFVAVLGGAYFFLPGVRALRHLAGGDRG
jgi:deferrochelatase/peroxidase EfeB